MSARIVAVLLLVAIPAIGEAQESPQKAGPVPEAVSARVDQFFSSIGRGQAKAAFDTLLEGSVLAQQTESVAGLVTQTTELESRYGRFISAELVQARTIGRDLVVFRYLYKCEQFPVAWTLVFYNPRTATDTTSLDTGWRVIAVRFDTEVESLARDLVPPPTSDN